jgi:predicted DCC family thiol-disulfide oxidoreductase YuxK
MRTTVIYDSGCALCTQSVRLIRRLDWRRALDYLDAQNPTNVHQQFPALVDQLDAQELLGEIHVVVGDRVFAGYAGMRAIVRWLPLVIGLYPLMFVPGITWIGARIYKWVAAHRYQLNRVLGGPVACDGGTCKVHGK